MAHIDPRPAEGAGLFTRFVYWLAKRRFGRVPVPLAIMAYSNKVLQAVGGYEMAAEKTRAIAPRLKALAELKTASIVGCRFCIDIGSSLASKHGISADELREIPCFEDSPRFTALEKQVLRYFRARFNHAFGAKEEGYSEHMVCMLPAATERSA
jgi:AhpD family alkylhydroperoxidase